VHARAIRWLLLATGLAGGLLGLLIANLIDAPLGAPHHCPHASGPNDCRYPPNQFRWDVRWTIGGVVVGLLVALMIIGLTADSPSKLSRETGLGVDTQIG
jgi:hypothetical protein